MIWTIFIILAVVGLDQWTKVLALEQLRPIKTFPIVQDVLHLTYVENRGAAFGMLAEHRWIFMGFSVAAILAILVWLFREKPKSAWIRCAAAFIVGGGIGNMIDRIARGFVVDFIDVRCIDFYVFNVADSFVCVGCAMFFVWVLRSELLEKKKKNTPAAEGDAHDTPDTPETPDSADGTHKQPEKSATAATDPDREDAK